MRRSKNELMEDRLEGIIDWYKRILKNKDFEVQEILKRRFRDTKLRIDRNHYDESGDTLYVTNIHERGDDLYVLWVSIRRKTSNLKIKVSVKTVPLVSKTCKHCGSKIHLRAKAPE